MNGPHRTSNLVYRRWRPDKDREEAERQAQAIRQHYPDGDPDTSIGQITEYLDGMLRGTDAELIWCIDSGRPVGLVAYTLENETTPPFCFIYTLAVLPSHQRRGIGTALLEGVKEVVRGRLPIIVRGINDVAIPRLMAAGFWEISGFTRNRRFKWSDLPEHQNNNAPWPSDDD